MQARHPGHVSRARLAARGQQGGEDGHGLGDVPGLGRVLGLTQARHLGHTPRGVMKRSPAVLQANRGVNEWMDGQQSHGDDLV